jgi:site-specific DNA recombinase
MRSVVAYCRTACEPQGGPFKARSQSQALRRYAKQRGLSLASVYTDAGVSGATLQRPALRRLLADCRAGKVEVVVTKDAARLSRDTGKLFALLYIFEEAGVNVVYSAGDRQSDRLLALMLSSVAKLEETKAPDN